MCRLDERPQSGFAEAILRFAMSTRLIACIGVAGAVFASPTPAAAEQSTEDELQQLRREIDAQRKLLEAQQKRLEQLELKSLRGRGTQTAQAGDTAPAPATKPGVTPTQVGQPPDTSRAPEVPALVDIRGVLTARNTLILEPSLQYSHSSNNRVALVGFTIIPAITIGLIDVRRVSRDTFIGTLAARYGVTNRFELEAKVPYVYRHERTISRPFASPANADTSFEGSGNNMGDIELAARYQLNQPGPDRPYYVAGLRVKTRTGKDQFEVETDPVSGLQKQLPTGSGFYGIQPSLTAILPSDPAVFFGNFSYLWNKERDVGREFGKIDPGDAVGLTMGMGVALNERSSFSIAYDHVTVFRTRQNGIAIPTTSTVQVGSLLFGASYRLTSKTNLNLTLGVGVTDEAPNVQLTFRFPTEL
jgi:outer membrane putative beta-barrel porin/alpha-amylase